MNWMGSPFSELSPGDFARDKIVGYLQNDPIISEIFSVGKIGPVWPIPPPGDESGPCIYVSTLSAIETPMPGMDVTKAAIQIAVRFAHPVHYDVAVGEQGIDTLMQHVRQIIGATGHRKLQHDFGDGQLKNVATDSDPAAITYHGAPLSQSEVVLTVIQGWNYGFQINPSTGRVLNVEAAGGYLRNA